MKFSYTLEQVDILDSIKKTKDNICIQAIAGSAKTFTLLEGIKQLPSSTRIQICCFNKHNSDDIISKVGASDNIKVNTFHSLAMRKLRVPYSKVSKYKKSYTDYHKYITKGITNKYLIEFLEVYSIGLINKYLQSDSSKIEYPKRRTEFSEELHKWHYNINLNDVEVVRLLGVLKKASKLFSYKGERCLINNGIHSFDTMLKKATLDGVLYTDIDCLVIEEFGDLNSLMIQGITEAANKGIRVITAGDSAQSIYLFSGSVPNVAERILANCGCKQHTLTTSFRCPDFVINKAVSEYTRDISIVGSKGNRMSDLLDISHLKIAKGKGDSTKPATKNTTHLCTTNAICLHVVLDLVKKGMQVYSPSVARQLRKDLALSERDSPYSKKLNLKQVSLYTKALEVLESDFDTSERVDQVLTIHKSKGLQYQNVVVHSRGVGDSGSRNKRDIKIHELIGFTKDIADLQRCNLMYVGKTRALCTLQVVYY